MKFTETKLKGFYIIELEPIEDDRGIFARSFCKNEFKKHGLDFNIVQCNISYNKKRGTLRGMHYQAKPYEEAKIVSCIQGAIYDVIIDLRPDSPTYYQWISVVLHGYNAPLHSSTHTLIDPLTHLPIHSSTHSPIPPSTHKLIYVPVGFAHGFQTLEDNTVVYYQMSEFYHPECARGVRWDDLAFGVEWPVSKIIMSDKDKNWPLLVRGCTYADG